MSENGREHEKQTPGSGSGTAHGVASAAGVASKPENGLASEKSAVAKPLDRSKEAKASDSKSESGATPGAKSVDLKSAHRLGKLGEVELGRESKLTDSKLADSKAAGDRRTPEEKRAATRAALSETSPASRSEASKGDDERGAESGGDDDAADRDASIEDKSIENKSIENKSIENKSTENKSTENKSTEKSVEDKSVENKADAKSTPPAAAESSSGKTDDKTGGDAPKRPSKKSAPISVRYFGQTDVGLIREHNEDNFMVADLSSGERGVKGDVIEADLGEKGLVFAVCDGMGGAAAGEVASQMAVDAVYEVLDGGAATNDRDTFAARLVTSVEEAGNRIFSAAKMDRSRRGMGTTATVAGFIDKVLFVGQVGDSRAYVLRGGQVGLITKDQSLVNQLIEAGQLTEEEAEAFEHSNIILQALGTTEEVSVDLTFLELRRGDRLLLCSDGLSGLVHADILRETLANHKDPKECCQKLIEMANNAGGHDNITCVVADFEGDALSPPEGIKPAYQQYPLPLLEQRRAKSVPPREPRMKAPGAKPGADVKREEWDDYDAPRPFRWHLIALVMVVAAGAVFLLSKKNEPSDVAQPSPATEEMVAEPTTEPAMEELGPVLTVLVSTDVETGELYIDGDRMEELSKGAPLHVELSPGAYRFEVYSGGSAVVSRNVTVTDQGPHELFLGLPEGADQTSEPSVAEAGTPDKEATAAATRPATKRPRRAPRTRSPRQTAPQRAPATQQPLDRSEQLRRRSLLRTPFMKRSGGTTSGSSTGSSGSTSSSGTQTKKQGNSLPPNPF